MPELLQRAPTHATWAERDIARLAQMGLFNTIEIVHGKEAREKAEADLKAGKYYND